MLQFTHKKCFASPQYRGVGVQPIQAMPVFRPLFLRYGFPKEVGDLAEEQGDLAENQHLNLVFRWSITAVAKTHHKYCQRPKGRGQVSEMLTNSDHGW